jgi:plastocyanin
MVVVVRTFFISGVVAITALVPGCSKGNASSSYASSVNTQAVTVADFSFDPRCVKAPAGSSLSITNRGATAHTFTVNGTTINLKLNGSATGTASLEGVAPGTYEVVCTLHPQMGATLIVS